MSQHSVDEWTTCLATKPLAWPLDQRTPFIRGMNGTNYDDAIDALISRRVARGEYVIRVRPSHILPQEETGEVEVIDYGGKGGMMRIVHPTCVW